MRIGSVKEEQILRRLAERGDVRAKAEIETLDVTVDELTWEGYRILSATRTYNANGPNPISLSEIQAWLTFAGIIDSLQKFRLMNRFIELDGEWINWINKNGK